MVKRDLAGETKAPSLPSTGLTVVVGSGDQQRRFTIPREYLCQRWNTLLTTADKDDLSQGKVEELNNMSPAGFNLYRSWLCGKGLTVDELWKRAYKSLSGLYVLSRPLQDIKFRDAIFDGIIDKFNSNTDNVYSQYVPGPKIVQAVYAETEKGSFLRKLVVRMYEKRANQKCMRNTKEPREFLVDFIDGMMGDGNRDVNLSDEEAAELEVEQNEITVRELEAPGSKKRKRPAESEEAGGFEM